MTNELSRSEKSQFGSLRESVGQAKSNNPLRRWQELLDDARDVARAGDAKAGLSIARQARAAAEKAYGEATAPAAESMVALSLLELEFGEHEASSQSFTVALAMIRGDPYRPAEKESRALNEYFDALCARVAEIVEQHPDQTTQSIAMLEGAVTLVEASSTSELLYCDVHGQLAEAYLLMSDMASSQEEELEWLIKASEAAERADAY